MNFDKVKDQFGSWADALRPFIESDKMDKIFSFLKQRSVMGAVVCPHHTDVFRAFRECALDTLRCVVVGQDPYPWIRDGSYAADGLAFSCSHTGKLEPSLTALYEGMEDDLSEGMDLKMHRNPDLGYLARQGVLLLNSSLTVEKENIGAHAPFVAGTERVYLWEPFMHYVLDTVLNNHPPVVFLFMGRQAQRYAKDPVPFHHRVLEVEHPAAASYHGGRWDHEKVFSRANAALKSLERTPIQWYEPLE